MARHGSHDDERRLVLWRTRGTISAGRRLLCVPARGFRRPHCFSLRLDVSDGHGPRADGGAGDRCWQLCRLHFPLASPGHQVGSRQHGVGALRDERSQFAFKRGVHAHRDMVQTRSAGCTCGLGFRVSLGIMVELRSVCDTTCWFAATRTSAGSGFGRCILFFRGWWDVTKISGEIRDPRRTLPRALVLGVLIVTVAYVSVSGAFLYLVPIEKVTSDETFVAQAGEQLFGATGGTAFAAVVILCVLGSLAAFMMAAPRVYYAMANDGLFLPTFARTHPRFRTPANAIMLQSAIACVLIFLGSFQQILGYFVFAAVAFIGLTVAGLFVIRRRDRNTESVILTAGYPFTPLFFLLLVALLLVLLAGHNPREVLLGSVVVLTGLPVHALFAKQWTEHSKHNLAYDNEN